jgi:myo-inositol-1(or 4)-monophosphatase
MQTIVRSARLRPGGWRSRALATLPAAKLDTLEAAAKKAARSGAEQIWARIDVPRRIEKKGLTDLVTDTDKASEKAIFESLNASCGDHAILGEESAVLLGNVDSPFVWIVDPLDGTTNFTHSYAPFAVSVGLLHDGQPVVACVIEFVGGQFGWATREWTSSKGRGCYCNGRFSSHASSIPVRF